HPARRQARAVHRRAGLGSRAPVTRRTSRGLYVLFSLASLGLITTANRLGGRWLQSVRGGAFSWLADLCVPSFLVCLAAYLLSRPARSPLALPVPGTDWRRVARLGGGWLVIWLAACALAAVVTGHWIRYTTGTCATLCFVVVGPAQEELLFRGALYG